MKKILIVIMLSVLVGCSGEVSKVEFDAGVEACKTNGGVEKITVDTDTSINTFQCANGANFKYRFDKIWK